MELDPDAHQIKKENAWHSGLRSLLAWIMTAAHTIEVIGDNTHDDTIESQHLTGEKKIVYGDGDYRVEKHETENCENKKQS